MDSRIRRIGNDLKLIVININKITATTTTKKHHQFLFFFFPFFFLSFNYYSKQKTKKTKKKNNNTNFPLLLLLKQSSLIDTNAHTHTDRHRDTYRQKYLHKNKYIFIFIKAENEENCIIIFNIYFRRRFISYISIHRLARKILKRRRKKNNSKLRIFNFFLKIFCWFK